jgi:hypothetical protein
MALTAISRQWVHVASIDWHRERNDTNAGLAVFLGQFMK